MASSDRFGYEWQKYPSMAGYENNYREQFINWVWPYQEKNFKGKSVLDVGCGMGRNSFWCLTWGAKEVVATDAEPRTVLLAKKTLSGFANAKAVCRSVYALGWENRFDMAICIGVIHHLAEPEKALKELIKAVKPGGEVLLWVYSREGFEWYLKLLQPVRQIITSRLPSRLVYFVAFGGSLPLYSYLRLFTPKSNYLRQLKSFKLRHIHGILFDQLIPAYARYYSREETENLLADLDRVHVVRPRNGSGWVVRGKKPFR